MKKFVPPTIEEAKEYANSIGFKTFNASKWWFFYNSKGWMVGKTKMKCWKSAVQTWFIDTHEWRELQRRKTEYKQKRDSLREEYSGYIRSATEIKLIEMRKAPEWEFIWFLIDELRPKIYGVWKCRKKLKK